MVRLRTRKQETADTTSPEVYPAEGSAEEFSDHGLHVECQTCARCGHEIKANDEARKTLQGDCVHLSC